MLLQNCGNRSIYASSSHLNNLLNSTSLSLLESTLLLGSELAQRYQAALKRMNIPVRHVSNALLTNHYNIDLDRVLELAMPLSRIVTTAVEATQPNTPATPSVKGKEKAYFNIPTSTQKGPTTTVYANDLVSMVKGGSGVGSSPKGIRSATDNGASASGSNWDEWANIKVKYYPKPAPEAGSAGSHPRTPSSPSPALPITPTPIRRSSNLGPHGQRSNRQPASDESPPTLHRSSTFPNEDTPRPDFKVIDISPSKVKSTDIHTLLRENISGLPQEFQYKLLSKLRVAQALTTSLDTRRQLLAIRLLAITNLAYIHAETTFQETVLKQDSDEPRRLQLAYQLAELVHPPAEGDIAVPRPLQTLAFAALDALAGHQSKFSDVCAALNTNVNHGVLLYVVRKAVAEMNGNDEGDDLTEEDEWREALFSLISNLSINPRTGADLVTAGLMPILVEVLTLRTNIAERYHPTILSFLDTILYSTRDALQTLVNAEGLDAVSDLIIYEVKASSENAASGKGMGPEYRSAAVDYEIPFFPQQTLKWLFKFIHHMMSSAGGYGGNFDRLLRNLIDSSQLLSSLRRIISNAQRFGSIVWTHAVSILNDFINNEPTSFAVIAEAGLSRALLEAVTRTTIIMPSEPKARSETGDVAVSTDGSSPSPPSDDDDSDDDSASNLVTRPSHTLLQAPREGPLARGIMPTAETINIVPQAFGAICLNNAGMKMFQASKALESFFEIFESPEHVKVMDSNKDLPSNLGGTFDELVRHHPPLKTAIMSSILNMVARVGYLCKTKAENDKVGAKLWITDALGNTVIADDDIKARPVDRSSKGKGKAVDDGNDVEMRDADSESVNAVAAQPLGKNASMTPYISVVATFLSAMLGNSSVRSDFSSKGGIDYVLDLADSPCLAYDFGDGSASRMLHQVIAILAESKPHLTMPSLLKRAQSAADTLKPFAAYTGDGLFFAPFVNQDSRKLADVDLLAKGTDFAKALVNIHSLVATINSYFQNTAFNHRSASTSFSQINVADYYVRLVQSLGPLLGASLKEEARLMRTIPDNWKNLRRLKDSGFGEPTADTSPSVEPSTPALDEPEVEARSVNLLPNSPNGDASAPKISNGSPTDAKPRALTKAEQDSPFFKNYQIIGYLLSKMSRSISPFFQILGKSLVTKRTSDTFQKQSHVAIAEALADTVMSQFTLAGKESSPENYNYWVGILNVLRDVLIDGKHGKSQHEMIFANWSSVPVSRHNERPVQAITLVLQAFKDHGGFKILNRVLEVFTSEICSNALSQSEKQDEDTEEYLRLEMATSGARNILTLYSQLINGKNVTEAIQTTALSSRSDRDRNRVDYFSSGQFLVELRMAVLPTIRRLWGSDLIEKGSSSISEKLIEVIRAIAAADFETQVIKRSDKPVTTAKGPPKTFRSNSEYQTTVTDHGYDMDLANEALYRCNNNVAFALEYCREVVEGSTGRNPVPDGDIAPTPDAATSSRPRTTASTGTATPDDHAMAGNPTISNIIGALTEIPAPPSTTAGETVPANFDQLLSQFIPGLESRGNEASEAPLSLPRATSSSGPQLSPLTEEAARPQITVDDLNEERDAIRDNLIDKCLDVINAHGEVTFEVSDLITTVVNKSSDPAAQRKVVGETLVIALMSFAGEDDLSTCGKKIAAYAHLLALMLRDKMFYAVAVAELKENLSTLLSFVKLSPNQSPDEPGSSPWIAQILLIIEMLLSEDARPRKTSWTPPKDENDTAEPPVLEPLEPSVPQDERTQLIDAIFHILPKIGKDESLALAVLRILVILTRTRSVAQSVGEKKYLQRLFVMAKQLAGASSARLQSPLMLILRHIIEDDETVKQIMRADIKSFFETTRQQRVIDEKAYLRGLAHTALRNPELFVEVTNEMVKFNRWTYQPSEAQSRHHSLVLKEKTPEPTNKTNEDAVQPTVQATEDLSIQDVKPSTEAVDSEMPDAPKPANEQKLPVLENPDGVIHFLLCELLNYKDVEDKDPVTASVSTEKNGSISASNGDVAMAGTSSASDTATPKDVKSPKPSTKQDFKPEDHPMYIYRCFILQCLTELLSSYNRTKIEFINFKRSAPPQAMTPSKPRSSVVNYLLFDLIPIGTLDHVETTALRKKLVTSSWADSVLTALLSKTGEQPIDKTCEPYDSDNEPALSFVRRFVLENILKAYKDASSSTEPLDVKYARMLALAILMYNIMNGKENVGMSDTAVASASQKQLRRIMFEKGYVNALTASIADIDLNFPNAKRAVKYILRPLKILTTTAVDLSDLSLISTTPGQNDEEEIESATSVSEHEDEREETPDLFRNSTLGMFEPGREEDSSSESDDGVLAIFPSQFRHLLTPADDEEMYEGEYDDEMEYEEDGPDDDEDNISDEDEEIEGMGPIEGLSGDHGVDVEVIMEDDDDEDDEDDSSDEDDDDEHDSEDDDARVEIIDEAGNVQQLAEEDDVGEWESDDDDDEGEEEDYEGQAEDQEEEQLHAMAGMGAMEGPIRHLVRALQSGDDDDAADIMEHMEAEAIEHGEDDGQLGGGEYEENDEDGMSLLLLLELYDSYFSDDDEDEDDIDEEEMMFDQFPST
jgi:E3 ubiquitin-protein ligase HUWE1